MVWPVRSRSLGLLLLASSLGCAGGEVGDFTAGNLTFGSPTTTTQGPTAGMETEVGNDTEPGDTDGQTGGNDSGGVDTSGGPPPGDSGPGCTPSPELCDGMDNDCDGAIDNGNPESGDPCDTGNPGICADGLTACEGGAITCVQQASPAAEVCDGIDNDCNGTADDDVTDAGSVCSTGMPGICADGTSSCAGGMLECIPDQTAQAEACDGLDNDCDGSVDNGNPGGGGACATGLPGICAAGTNQCTGGSIQCQQNQMAGVEACGNGLDDDCDGSTDEGCAPPCAHDLCVTGVALVDGCDPCVTMICAVDPFCCSNSWDGICVGEVTSICGIPCP